MIEAVIGLGPNLFFYSPMEACILVCRSHKSLDMRNKIIFNNAIKEVTSKNAESYLEDEHIQTIIDAYLSEIDKIDFKRIVPLYGIEDKDFDLSVQKYVLIDESDTTYIDIEHTVEHWRNINLKVITNLDQLINLL